MPGSRATASGRIPDSKAIAKGTDARQQAYTKRQSNRQDYADDHYHGGGYYGGYYDDDDWDDGEVAAVAIGSAAVGAMAGYAAGTSDTTTSTVVYTSPPPAGYTSLPCTPGVIVVSGVTYYQCGSSWYTQAYGNSGVTYMPVPPPAGY